MNIQPSIDRLTRSAAAIRAMVENVDDAEARWRPADGTWSVLEIVCHLADEDREDFRMRLELTLRDPHADWPSIDPAVVVVTRDYNSRTMSESIAEFLRERDASITWLRSLDDPDLARARAHPVVGSIAAGELLHSWVAHDLLHIRQIARVQYLFVAKSAAPYSVTYADPTAQL